MKKKFISALLFGAILAASSSTLVSCKDYDDDISNLQGQITTNASDLSELVNEKVNNLTQEINSLKAQDATLEAALNTAKSELTATIEEAAQGAKDYADVQAAAAQVAAIEASKANIEEARKVLQAAIDDANASIEKLNSQVATQAEQIDGLLSADAALQAAINTANGEIEVAKSMAEAAQNAADQNAEALKQVAENLATAKSELESQISVLGDKIDGAIEDIAKNKADVEAQLATVNSLISSNTEAIEALKNTDSELLGKITENTEKLTAMADELALVDSKLAANLEAAKAYTDTEIAALKVALTGDIEAVRSELASAVTRIGAVEEKIEGINEAIESLKGEDQKLNDALNSLSEKVDLNIEATNSEIAKIYGKIEALEGTVGTHTTQISDLQATAKKLQDDLATVTITANEAKENLAQLQAKFEAYVESNAQAMADLKEELNSDLNTAIAKLGESLREELQVEVGKLNTTIGELQTKDTELQKQIDALKTQIGAISGDQSVVGLIDEKIEAVNEKIKNLTENEIADLTSRISVAENEINNIYQELAQNSATIGQAINVFSDQMTWLQGISKQLKSLVFSPNEYYQGIEAIGVWSFNYNAKTVSAANTGSDQKTDRPSVINQPETSVVPIVQASYYMNPSNASIDTVTANVKKHFSYIVNNASYTRATNESKISIDSARYDETKNGLLNVFFSMKDANDISSIGNGKVDVVALRYNYPTENGDTVVTSDFAALKQYVITDFIINKVSTEGNVDKANAGENHLATTAAGALTSNVRLQIAYNNAEGIDLDKWINVHYTVNGSADLLWGGQETINKKKFKLHYELIGYKADDSDNTNESQHATIDQNTNILKVHGVDGHEGNRNIIGRTPLVRVTLIDQNTNNQIAEVGYILVEITDVIVKPVTVEDVAAITNGYTVNCDDATILNNVRAITWVEVENKVLGELNMSKEEFEANYTLDTYGDGSCKQYSAADDKNLMAQGIGKIINTNDPEAHETNVLKWTVTNQQAYDLFVIKNKTSVSTWVKFVPNSSISSHKAVFVKLTWTPSVINKTPIATIQDSDKKVADWHATNSREPGFAELHIQPGNATVAGATCKYETMTTENTFNTKPLDIIKRDISNTYPVLASEAKVIYKFAPASQQPSNIFRGVSGSSYGVSVSYDGSSIMAGSTPIARITPENGAITLDENDVTKDIINYYNNVNAIAEALTFKVVIEPKTCKPAEGLITLNSNTFNVKVIKPIFITDSKVNEMTLNNASTLTQPVTLNFVDFNNYDPQEFWDNSNEQVSFWDFYHITNIEVDNRENKGYRTNYSGSWKEVDTNDFEIEFIAPTGGIKLNNMGKVKLTQKNMSLANSFDVEVNLVVTYKWGKLYMPITVHVNKAGN